MEMSKPKVNKEDVEITTKAHVCIPIGNGEYMYHEFRLYTDESTHWYVEEQLENKYEFTE